MNRENIWQAVYTAGVNIPTPITGATYWHRSLNPKKLLDVGFSHKPANLNMSRYMKLHNLKSELLMPNLRPMEAGDVPQVTSLLNNYLSNQKFHIVFSEEEVHHFMLPRQGVINSFVNGDSNRISEFFSFYELPSSILNHPGHDTLRVAYSYYNVSSSGRLMDGMRDMLNIAKTMDQDVFNALDVMEN